jgi:threonyl-tRNA synthetase
MTENYAGDFPFWLAPEQIRLLPVTDEVLPWAEELLAQLRAAGVRASLERSGERLGKLIRNGETMKIPVLAVIGAKEAEARGASLRSRSQGELGLVGAEALVAAATAANHQRAASLGLEPVEAVAT